MRLIIREEDRMTAIIHWSPDYHYVTLPVDWALMYAAELSKLRSDVEVINTIGKDKVVVG